MDSQWLQSHVWNYLHVVDWNLVGIYKEVLLQVDHNVANIILYRS